MSENAKIQRHRNGSIDIGHYRVIGRSLHGRAVREAGKGLMAELRGLCVAMKTGLCQFPDTSPQVALAK
jgi:hypothetical protein